MAKKKQGWQLGEGEDSKSAAIMREMTREPQKGLTDNMSNRRKPGGMRDAVDISKIIEANAGDDVVGYTSNYSGKKNR